MPNANIKKVISVLVVIALLSITGCSSPEKKRIESLERITQLRSTGDNIAALEQLEKLSQKYPDDSEILQQIGQIYQELGNDTEAAFYLTAAHNLSPNNTELLYQAYIANEDADQPEAARDLLEIFAKTNPKAMANALWFRLGELRAQANKTESALEAYLEGIKLTNERPSAEISLAIGTLFKQLDNLPMAGRWLAIAARSDDPNSLPALFGLLEINLSSKNWEAAEKCIELLDKKFPGAVDASEWANARGELKKWRTAQTELKTQLEKMALAEKEIEAEEKASVTSEQPIVTEKAPAETSGKAQVITDIATAEALATKPANDEIAEETPEPPAEQTEPEIVFDPSIVIQPAEPEIDSTETADQQNQEIPVFVDYSTNYQSSATSPEPVSEPSAQPDLEPSEPYLEPNKPNIDPDEPLSDAAPLTLEELIISAEKATSRRDYEKAIQFYWAALGQTNKRADIWNALSKVYLIDGQAKNAATTALEATRLNPENIEYVLDYLRVVQRVKKSADFIKELEIAYDRFPRSPEITLSLARGYHKIGGNDYAASILYQRFIEIAPTHPLRPEAEAALAKIR